VCQFDGHVACDSEAEEISESIVVAEKPGIKIKLEIENSGHALDCENSVANYCSNSLS
jgi:hypothetical protein